MWVDMSATDLPGAVRFYTELFGWQAEDLGDEAGHYTMMRKDGKMAAAGQPGGFARSDRGGRARIPRRSTVR